MSPTLHCPAILKQIIQECLPVLGLYPRTPSHHFVDLAFPLSAREPLLADDIIVVAYKASFAKHRNSRRSGNIVGHGRGERPKAGQAACYATLRRIPVV